MQKTTEHDTSSAEAKKNKKSSFAGDVMKLVTGTTIAQGLVVLASPLLARLYAPEDFGLLALFMSITSILGVIACLRYELAIMLPESDGEAVNLLAVSVGFTILTASLTAAVVWLWGRQLLEWLNVSSMVPYLWLLPLTVLVQGVFQALNYWNSRTKHFGRLSIARVTSSTATVSTQLGAGYAGYATGGTLIGGNIIGKAVSTTVLGGQIWRDDRKTFIKSMRWGEMRKGIKRYRKFPMFSTWSALMNTISIQLPAILLSTFFSLNIVGFYALGHRLLSIPMSLIGSSVSQVFYQRASMANTNGTLHEVVEKTFRHLLLLSCFPFLLIAIISPEIFLVIFGEQWIKAGIFVQILSPWLFFVFCGSPISTLNSVLELQEVGLLFNILLILTRFITLVTGGLLNNVYVSLILYSASGTILWAWFCFYLVSYSGIKLRNFINMICKKLFIASLFLIPVILTKWILSKSIIILLLIGFLTTIFYYIYVLYQSDVMFSFIMNRKQKYG